MAPLSKAEVRQNWHEYVRAHVGPPPTPPSPEMERWIRLQQALARYSPAFHGSLMAGYNTSGPAFDAVLKALELGFQAAAGPYERKPTFRGV